MALWRRIRRVGFESYIYRLKRWYSVLPGGGDPAAGCTRFGGFRAMDEPFSGGGPMFRYTHFRSFVASEQAKPKIKLEGKGGDWRKPKVEEHLGIRLNEAIKEHEVRLVTDQGHRIVSIQEALYLAKKLDLDLVEVQRRVKDTDALHKPFFKPAVCKLMDYYKEKYKQDLKGKERAKSKASIALRGGENKEVRFKAKTELNDLKIKADSVKRLMERGYRVKCIAMPTGKDDDEQLGGLLLNLLSLLEDISVVESGPHVDTKNAYVILKHVKFASKKGKKLSKVMETVSSVLSARANNATVDASKEEGVDIQTEEEQVTVESDSKTYSEVSVLPKEVKTNTTWLPPKVTERSDDRKPEPPHVIESNRYNKGGSNATFHPIRRSNRDGLFPGNAAATGDLEGRRMAEQTSRRNESESGGQLNPDSSFSRYGAFSTSPRSNPQQRYGAFSPTKSSPSSSSVCDSKSTSPTSSSYGIFSTPKTITSEDQMKRREANRDNSSPRFGMFTTSKTATYVDSSVSQKN